MPRKKSEERRRALLDAAAALISEQGGAVPTAAIAARAGISEGSLFNYFPSKAELLNGLYLELKRDLAAQVSAGDSGSLRDRAWGIWSRWAGWGAASPEKRRALGVLETSAEVTAETRDEGRLAMHGLGGILGDVQALGALAGHPADFVYALVEAMVTVTMDFMARAPSTAEAICRSGFDAVWSALASPSAPLRSTAAGGAAQPRAAHPRAAQPRKEED